MARREVLKVHSAKYLDQKALMVGEAVRGFPFCVAFAGIPSIAQCLRGRELLECSVRSSGLITLEKTAMNVSFL